MTCCQLDHQPSDYMVSSLRAIADPNLTISVPGSTQLSFRVRFRERQRGETPPGLLDCLIAISSVATQILCAQVRMAATLPPS